MKTASRAAQVMKIAPAIKAVLLRAKNHDAVSRQQKRKPILAAKSFGPASTMTGLALSSIRIFLLILAKRLYCGLRKPRIKKSTPTTRMIHFQGVRRNSTIERKAKAALTRPAL